MKKTLILILFLLLLAFTFTFTFCTDPEGGNLNFDYDDSWGEEGDEDGEFYSPGGIFVFPDVHYGTRGSSGSVFITDTFNHRVQVFNLEMAFLDEFGIEGTGAGEFNEPSSVSVNVHLTPQTRGSSGSVFITDTFNHRIQMFDLQGNYIGQFGSEGSGEAEFNQPSGVSVSPITVNGSSGSVFITDTFNHRIQMFDLQGNYVGQFGSEGSGDEQFNKPGGIVFIPDYSEVGERRNGRGSSGSVFITDTFNHRIQIFTGDGEYVASFGSEGSGDGQFNEPEGIATDLMGNIYVADKGNHRIQVFDSEGNFLGKFGEQGSDTGQFENPEDVSVDADGSIYVADTGNNRIQRFVPQHKVMVGFDIVPEQDISAGTPSTVTVSAVDQNGDVFTGFSGEVNLFTTNVNISISPSTVTLTDGEGSADITFNNYGTTALLLPYNYVISQSEDIAVDIAKVYVSDSIGNDTTNDGTSGSPLATIEEALIQADTLPKPVDIIVAGDGGAYAITGGISLIEGISLKGGYESTGWTRDIVTNETIIEDISTTGGTITNPKYVISSDNTISTATIVEGFTLQGSISGVNYSSALYVDGGSPTISQCKLLGGSGATSSYGSYISNSAQPIIRESYIYGGLGGSSYGVYNSDVTFIQMYNNIITGGGTLTTTSSYGIYNDNSSAIIRNNTIYGGEGTSFSVGLRLNSNGSGSIIENNIIYSYNVSASSICLYESNTTSDPISLRNNDLYDTGGATLYLDEGGTALDIAGIEGLTDITQNSGNVSVDPEFEASGDGYHHLGASSPVSVTEGGIDGSVGAEDWGFDIDKDGNPRTGSGATGWSIGAYEYD